MLYNERPTKPAEAIWVKPLLTRGLNVAPNQYEICGDGWRMFQSYSSAIMLIDGSGVHISEHWDYSATTNKFRYKFHPMRADEIRRDIKCGYILTDLTLSGEVKDGWSWQS